ncbi:MAG: cyclic nucleotide-binding domain-containing protein [Dehalococcoidia bacterium]|nr:cyclic nucleotide-binding domain-containing protein [Dehalococcoidia bacterium]
MESGALGREYADREIICRQGESGNCMYVVQSGRLSVFREDGTREVLVGELKTGDVFGEMAVFDKQPRSATVRAKGQARGLTLDKRTFSRRVHEDPSLAFRILHQMTERIRSLNDELSHLRQTEAPG